MPALHDSLDHWRTLPIKQQPTWTDPDAVAAASAEIAGLVASGAASDEESRQWVESAGKLESLEADLATMRARKAA